MASGLVGKLRISVLSLNRIQWNKFWTFAPNCNFPLKRNFVQTLNKPFVVSMVHSEVRITRTSILFFFRQILADEFYIER